MCGLCAVNLMNVYYGTHEHPPASAASDDGSDAPAVANADASAGSSDLVNGLLTSDPNDFINTGVTNADGAMVVTYYFMETGEEIDQFGFNVSPELNFSNFEKQQVTAALDLIETFLNIEFTEVDDLDDAEMEFSLSRTGDDFNSDLNLGFAFFPSGAQIGSAITLNADGIGWDREAANNDPEGDDNGLLQGGNGMLTLVHEIGHALGLDHPFEGNGSLLFPGLVDNNNDGVADDTFRDAGSFDLNQDIYTAMSQTQGFTGHPFLGPQFSNDTSARAGSMMALDIASLQVMYGENTTHASGDDTYTIEDVTGAQNFYTAIWDTGGTDSITYSGSAHAVIDLRPASLQIEQGGGGFVSLISTVRGGYTIANDVVIENASSGSGDDELTGNSVANELEGGSGSDTLHGRGGDDLLNGGLGDDIMFGGQGDDTYVVNAAGDQVTEAAGEGTDTVRASVNFTLGVNIEALRMIGSDDLSATGNGAANTLVGNAAANTLSGEGGDDILNGLNGIDTLIGGSGNDRLNGGAGGDRFEGGAGDDIYILNSGADVVVDLAGEGTDRVQSAVSFALGDHTENLTLTGAGDTKGFGNGLDNTIRGNVGANTLAGRDGSDIITGGGGNDSVIGGNGADTLGGGIGSDTISGGASDDVISGDAGDDTIDGGTGNDRINAGTGNDVIIGGTGDDTLTGAGGADILTGGVGNDQQTGGGGADRYIFEDGFGNDELIGFSRAEDVIDLSGVSGIVDFADLLANHLSQDAGGALISDGTDTILLAGVQSGLLAADDFDFTPG